MSSYGSSSDDYEEEYQSNQLMAYGISLVNSEASINQWRQHTSKPLLEYLRHERQFAHRIHSIFFFGEQMRLFAFCDRLLQGFVDLNAKYATAYRSGQQPNLDIVEAVKALDLQLKQLVGYLHTAEANMVMSFFEQLYSQKPKKIYTELFKAADFCLDLQTLWLAVLTPKMFREENKQSIYKLNYGGTRLYYQKQLHYLMDRIKRLENKQIACSPQNEKELLTAISIIISSTKIKDSLKSKIVSLLKGQYYAGSDNKTLKQRFILSSFEMYYSQEISEIWDYEKYEKLCLEVLKESLSNDQYIICTLFMEPEYIPEERRTLTLEYAEVYDSILSKIIQLRDGDQIAESKPDNKYQISLSFLCQLLQNDNIQLFGHLLTNFLIANKNAFSLNSARLDKLIFSIFDKVRQIYLSFSADRWYVPGVILSAWSTSLFNTFSQDIKPELTSLLPMMVEKMDLDKMPTVVDIRLEGGKHIADSRSISRAQYLKTLFGYIRDAEFKDQDFYLDLPQVTPSSFQTSILFIRTLQLKLKHHEPTEDQKKLWVMILQQIMHEYKLAVDFKWFKPARILDSIQRETEFLIHNQIKEQWAFEIVQDVLNERDRQILDKHIRENAAKFYISEVVEYYKFAPRLFLPVGIWPVNEEQIFLCLERMRVILESSFFEDAIVWEPKNDVLLNELHLYLQFYNTKVKEARGNQIYQMIALKLMIPWFECRDKQACTKFGSKFSQFFQTFILSESYLAIADSLPGLLSDPSYDKQDLITKLVYFLDGLSTSETIRGNSVERNAEAVQKIFSALHNEMDVDVIIKTIILVIKFIKEQPIIEEEYVSVGFLLDFITNDDSRFQTFFTKLEETDDWANDVIVKINLEFIKRLPEYYNQLCFKNVARIIHKCSSFPELAKSLQALITARPSLTLHLLRVLTAEKIKILEVWQVSMQTQANQQLTERCWRQLEEYVDKGADTKQGEKNVKISQILQAFDESTIKKFKDNYKKLLNQGLKKKANKGKIEQKIQEKVSPEALTQKYQGASILRKVVRNCGTFEDLIMFGEDPMQTNNFSDEQVYEACMKVIKQKEVEQKYLKKIIRRLPVLLKCAQTIIGELRADPLAIVQPELLLKLYMINSRYRSAAVEEFLLEHIEKIPIPLQIYQPYLVTEIRKQLQSLPKNILENLLYGDTDMETVRRVGRIFGLLVCLPIDKYQHVYIRNEDKIEEAAEGGEWETESDKISEGSQEESSSPEKNPAKQDEEKEQQVPVDNDNSQSHSESDQHEDSNMSCMDSNSDEDEEDYGEDYDDESSRPDILKMFYEEGNQNLRKYQQMIKIRESLNIEFQDNYLSLDRLRERVKQNVEVQKQVLRLVDILENQLSNASILTNLLNKMPENLHGLLAEYGLTKEPDYVRIAKYRKETTRMPKFTRDNADDEDQEGSEPPDYQEYDDGYGSEGDGLSEESDSVEEDHDQYEFAAGEDPVLGLEVNPHIESDEEDIGECVTKPQQRPEEQELTYSLPQLRQINSKIDNELTGKELTPDDMVKLLEVAIVQLFSLHIYQLKHKPVFQFYRKLVLSKQGKIFLDTLFTVLRIGENYSGEEELQLARKLAVMEMSVPRALANMLSVCYEISSEDSKESTEFAKTIRQEVGNLLPIGDHIMIKSNIPVQDNFLTLLIFYSRYSQASIHLKTKLLLVSLNEDSDSPYQLTKHKAGILSRQIYRNSNNSSIWYSIQENFNVQIDEKVKFTSCLTVYGKMLRLDLEKCYHGLLKIIDQSGDGDGKGDSKAVLKQQEKKVEQNLAKQAKRVKHYYYWSKRNILSEVHKSDKKSVKLLKNKQLIRLTELMIFYCHLIRQKFHQKIDEKAMKHLLVLPKSIIETSFILLEKLGAKIDKWQPLSNVKQYFKAYNLYEHKFGHLQQVCNLVLDFLDLPEFSQPRFKQIIIPFLIDNPKVAHEIPLIFKLPNEELEGQKLYLTRQCSFDMAFYQLVSKSFTIEFKNEEGSDHGGMVRELMMGWPGLGVGEEHIFIGRLLAFSFRMSIPYGGHFDIAMAVAISQYKVTIEFLEQVEPEVAKNLKYVMQAEPEDLDDLDMKFEITKEIFGAIRRFPLKQGGSDVPVTAENRSQYQQLFLQKYFLVGREWEMSQLCAGFYSSVNRRYAGIFNPFQLIQKIQGEEINDYMKLKKKTKYAQGYTESSQMIKWFWEIVAQFSQKQMNRFLQFITGAPKVSIYNNNFEFVIEKPYGDDLNRLPVAHTCFNDLELPEYKTKQILEKKLLQAINQGNDNFGIL